MKPDACNGNGCTETPVVVIGRASERHLVKQEAYCGAHVQEFLANYYASQHVGGGTPRDWGEAVEFDVELVLYDGRQNAQSLFCLREVGGTRRLDCGTGPFEAWMLHLELQGLPAPRPLTHRAMASLITSLGGRLDYVVVDTYVAAQRLYEAKLSILQMSRNMLVDVRISDAVILAVVSNVPIVVSNDVLRALAEPQR